MTVESATVSAHTGIAVNPKRVATGPSWATPFLASAGSCARSHTGKPNVAAYCSAWYKTWLSANGASACENATQPASTSSAISVSRSPFRPWVSAPTG